MAQAVRTDSPVSTVYDERNYSSQPAANLLHLAPALPPLTFNFCLPPILALPYSFP